MALLDVAGFKATVKDAVGGAKSFTSLELVHNNVAILKMVVQVRIESFISRPYILI